MKMPPLLRPGMAGVQGAVITDIEELRSEPLRESLAQNRKF